jgi:hypothetical protein
MALATGRTIYAASEGERFNADTELHVVECFSCHVTYAIPESFYQAARKHNERANPSNYWQICCPFGHSWHYTGLNREQKLERQLEGQRDETARVRAERDQAKASAAAQKGVATKLKKRAAAGLCPHCNRHFKDLERHVKGQHPRTTPHE